MRLEEKARLVTEVMEEKKGEDIMVMDLRGFSLVVDAFVICSAEASVQAQAISDGVERALSIRGVHLWRREGYAEGRWILMDYGDIVVHIFHIDARRLYDLDGLWGDAPRLSPILEEGQ